MLSADETRRYARQLVLKDLTVLGQLSSHVRAGLVDHAAHVAEPLVDSTRDTEVPIVHPP